jgi:membrane protein
MSLKSNVTDKIEEIRQRRPFVDHLVRTVGHYGSSQGSLQAGAVTYFAFLSFFPILALAVFAVGQIARIYPDAQHQLVQAIDQVLPGMVGSGQGQISLANVQSFSGWAGVIGLLGVMYSGLGWLSAMRESLEVVFELPAKEQPNFIIGKLRDLITLAVVGLTLMVAVAISGAVIGFSDKILHAVGLGTSLSPLLVVLSVVIGLAANTLLFYVLFRLLVEPHAPQRSLWSGALLGAVGFELLKQLSGYLIASTKQQPAFQAFGIALILVVWINYFSRVVLYAASWAHTSPEARAVSERLALEADRHEESMKEIARVQLHEAPADDGPVSARTAFAGGAAAMLGFIAVVRKRKK